MLIIKLQIDDPEADGRIRVVEGVCIVGRAPALHPGDMRVVRAVNKPALRYLHNVLVFPSCGDQDIPSMCSGGDLDGDDYTIIWDPDLLPVKGKRYIRPMSYEGVKPKVAHTITMKQIIDFVIDFMRNDQLGQIANLHLAYAHDDPGKGSEAKYSKSNRGFSKKCLVLAALHSCAVDFAKTGVPASIPVGYRRDTYPDFMVKTNKRSFVSDSPLSHMYRQVELSPENTTIDESYDHTLCAVPGMLEWLDTMTKLKSEYDQSLRRLMAQYSIQNEAEVVTGFILTYDQQFNDKREFEMRVDVASQYGIIRDIFRSRVHDISMKGDEGQILTQAQADRRKEAMIAAMYDVTFSQLVDSKDKSQAMLSFPWIFHDIIGRLSSQRAQRLFRGSQAQLSNDSKQELMNDQLVELLLAARLSSK